MGNPASVHFLLHEKIMRVPSPGGGGSPKGAPILTPSSSSPFSRENFLLTFREAIASGGAPAAGAGHAAAPPESVRPIFP